MATSTSQRPVKRRRIDFSDTIIVKVGQTETTFHVPRDLVCERSTFFKTACSDRWTKDKDGVVQLPEDLPDIFSTYLQTLLQGEVLIDSSDMRARSPAGTRIRTYVLADKLGDTVTANILMDEIVPTLQRPKFNTSRTLVDVLGFVCKNSPSGSPLRRLCAEHTAWLTPKDLLLGVLQHPATPPDFVLDVATALASRAGKMVGEVAFKSKRAAEWHLAESAFNVNGSDGSTITIT